MLTIVYQKIDLVRLKPVGLRKQRRKARDLHLALGRKYLLEITGHIFEHGLQVFLNRLAFVFFNEWGCQVGCMLHEYHTIHCLYFFLDLFLKVS